MHSASPTVRPAFYWRDAQQVAPPVFSAPALAALMGLDAAVTLALLLACTAVTPLARPCSRCSSARRDNLSARARPSPRADARGRRILARRRAFAGKPWVDRQAERIDGLKVVVLFLFAVALMGDVPPTPSPSRCGTGAAPLSTAVTFGLSGAHRAGVRPRRPGHGVPARAAAGSRNTGLMLAAAAGRCPSWSGSTWRSSRSRSTRCR